MYHFAWVNAGDKNWNVAFARDDEDVFGYELEHVEGSFATLKVTIKNPRVGLLAGVRKQWCWFSRTVTGTPVPMFFGRIVAFPDDLIGETITLSFIGRPIDYFSRKQAAATALKVAPFWDSVFFDEQQAADPDNVLHSRPARWHIDPVTHAVTASDCCIGEDGLITIDIDEGIRDSVQISFGEPPVRRVNIFARGAWDQMGVGQLDLGPFVSNGWSGTPFPGVANSRAIVTYNSELFRKWPEAGKSLGGGWSVGAGSAIELAHVVKYGRLVYNDDNIPKATIENIGNPAEGLPVIPPLNTYIGQNRIQIGQSPLNNDTANELTYEDGGSHGYHDPLPRQVLRPGPVKWDLNVVTSDSATGQQNGGHQFIYNHLQLPVFVFRARLPIQFDVTRARTEDLTMALEADTQAIVTDDSDSAVRDLEFDLVSLGLPVDGPDLYPVRDVRQNGYFNTARGKQSIEYMLMCARAVLLTSARAVTIGCEIPITKALTEGLSLRKNASLTDARLPGGTAIGKITSYRYQLDPDSGEESCTLIFACVVGKGANIVPEGGSPTYVAEGYVAKGYQRYSGLTVAPLTADLAYQDIVGVAPSDDDGVDFANMTFAKCVQLLYVSPPFDQQWNAMIAAYEYAISLSDWTFTDGGLSGASAGTPIAPSDMFERYNELCPLEIQIQMTNLERAFNSSYVVSTSKLAIPKGIDLEAS